MIKISVNGELKEVENSLSVTQLIEFLEYKQEGFAIAINMTFIPLDKYAEVEIKDSDKIDILSPVQGG